MYVSGLQILNGPFIVPRWPKIWGNGGKCTKVMEWTALEEMHVEVEVFLSVDVMVKVMFIKERKSESFFLYYSLVSKEQQETLDVRFLETEIVFDDSVLKHEAHCVRRVSFLIHVRKSEQAPKLWQQSGVWAWWGVKLPCSCTSSTDTLRAPGGGWVITGVSMMSWRDKKLPICSRESLHSSVCAANDECTS